MYNFLGKLMGMVIRSKNVLSLDLPSFFWKPLVGIEPTKKDLHEIDYSTCESLEKIETMTQEIFEASIFENFTTFLGDRKTIVELKEGGTDLPVSFTNRMDFVDLKWKVLLSGSNPQLAAILKGLGTIVPLPLLFLFGWKDIRYLICGTPDVDLNLLKKHTRYRAGVQPSDQHVQYFWKVLEEFSPFERSLFLRFAWGRERLPPENEFNEEMKIFPNNKVKVNPNPKSVALTQNQGTAHDTQLPHADTCFFNVTLPAYSTQKLMKEKLLIAITNTISMDGDTTNQEEGFNPIPNMHQLRRSTDVDED